MAQLDSKKGIKAVVICDRGAMDPSAYIDRELWLRMLKELGVDETDLRDHRYDCVVHLVTAAKGAEAFYTTDSNSVRSEGLEMARRLDALVMNAWVGHASLQVIDNLSVCNFAQKCDRVVQAVLTRLGLVADLQRYGKLVRKHKFIVKNFKMEDSFPVPFRDFNVERTFFSSISFFLILFHFIDIYLVNTTHDNMQIRLRRREQLGSASVHLNMTIRHAEHDGQRVETRRNLTFREFEALRAQADPSRIPIIKRRRCFLYKDRYFQIDVYKQPCEGLVMLEAYLDYESNSSDSSKRSSTPDRINSMLPEWFEVSEVTNEKEYSMFALALNTLEPSSSSS